MARDGEAGPAVELALYSGETAELRLGAHLHVVETCVQSFSLAVAHPQELLEIIAVTFDETDFEFYFDGAFSVLEVTRTGDGFVAAVQAGGECGADGGGSLLGPFPENGDFSLVFAQYRILPRLAPRDGELVVEGLVEYRDGLQGKGEPVKNHLTVNGTSVTPCTQSFLLRVTFRDTVAFSRGDANFDGKRDISDAVTIFNYLFLGKAPPPAPYPQAGADPTEDELRCRPR